MCLKEWLGGGDSNLCDFHPYLGKISNLTNIFQMGWFNQQLDDLGNKTFMAWKCTLKEATEAEKEAALQDLQVGFHGGQWDGWMEGHGA